MKLYATATSERSSKGQGGNKYLDIVLTGDTPDNVLYSLSAVPIGDTGDTLFIINDGDAYVTKRHGGGYVIPVHEARAMLKSAKTK